MLNVRRLDQYYGGSHTLWGVDLEVPEGSCTCLMGRNGVGKTTLLRAIMGLVPCAGGEVTFGDVELTRRAAEARAALGIGYVPQGREIFPQLTVEENLRLGLVGRAHARQGARSKTLPERIFELFPVLASMLRRRGGDLSGGQQQQLAIARALVLEPKLLILDEPTEGIQPNVVSDIGDVLIRLNREAGLTVLVVEQKLKFARRVAQRFAILDRGRSVAAGRIDELDDRLVAQYLTV
jgi:urea transport system ATP-binding protein